jgi:hypothetical protein
MKVHSSSSPAPILPPPLGDISTFPYPAPRLISPAILEEGNCHENLPSYAILPPAIHLPKNDETNNSSPAAFSSISDAALSSNWQNCRLSKGPNKTQYCMVRESDDRFVLSAKRIGVSKSEEKEIIG